VEIWKPVVDWPEYEVSNLGRVRSLPRNIRNRIKPGRILKPEIKRYKTGRPVACCVALARGRSHTKATRIHRMVLAAFVGPCPDGMQGCHNDGNPLNNSLENLRWDTRESNRNDMIRHGTYVPPPKFSGLNHPFAKLTPEMLERIRSFKHTRYDGLAQKLADEFGLNPMTIRRVWYGKSYRFD